MIQCPKCSSCRVLGPSYVQSEDQLVYTCMQCGYTSKTKPHDYMESEEHRRARKLLTPKKEDQK